MAYSLLGQVSEARTTTTDSVGVSVVYSGGERVLVVLIWNANGTNTVTVSDGTNIYSQLTIYVSTASGSNGTQYYAIVECKNATAGTFTVTGTINTVTNFEGIAVYRFSGLSSSAAAVVGTANEQAAPGTGADAVACNSMVPGSAPAMVFGYSSNLTDTVDPISGTGFTSRGHPTNWTPSGTFNGINVEDRRVITTASTAVTFTSSAGTETYVTLGIVIPEPATGTTVTPSQGTEALSGNSPVVVKNTNTVLTPAVAQWQRHESGLLVPERRKIFLPTRQVA